MHHRIERITVFWENGDEPETFFVTERTCKTIMERLRDGNLLSFGYLEVPLWPASTAPCDFDGPEEAYPMRRAIPTTSIRDVMIESLPSHVYNESEGTVFCAKL